MILLDRVYTKFSFWFDGIQFLLLISSLFSWNFGMMGYDCCQKKWVSHLSDNPIIQFFYKILHVLMNSDMPTIQEFLMKPERFRFIVLKNFYLFPELVSVDGR